MAQLSLTLVAKARFQYFMMTLQSNEIKLADVLVHDVWYNFTISIVSTFYFISISLYDFIFIP